nr:hypothetical protein [Tanacetum cinerariifolium]
MCKARATYEADNKEADR